MRRDAVETLRPYAGTGHDPREPCAQEKRLQRGRFVIPQVAGLERFPTVAQHARGPGIEVGCGDEEDAAGFEPGADFRQERARVADLVEHVGEDANVVAVGGVVGVGQGNVANLAMDDLGVAAETRAGGGAGGRGQIHAGGHPAAPGRLSEKMTWTATDLQQPRADRGTVAVEQVEELVGGMGAEGVEVGVGVGEKIGLAGELDEFVRRGLGVGEHQITIVTAHDAKTLHGELVRQAAAIAHRTRRHRAAGGRRDGVGVAHRPLVEADFVPERTV